MDRGRVTWLNFWQGSSVADPQRCERIRPLNLSSCTGMYVLTRPREQGWCRKVRAFSRAQLTLMWKADSTFCSHVQRAKTHLLAIRHSSSWEMAFAAFHRFCFSGGLDERVCVVTQTKRCYRTDPSPLHWLDIMTHIHFMNKGVGTFLLIMQVWFLRSQVMEPDAEQNAWQDIRRHKGRSWITVHHICRNNDNSNHMPTFTSTNIFLNLTHSYTPAVSTSTPLFHATFHPPTLERGHRCWTWPSFQNSRSSSLQAH